MAVLVKSSGHFSSSYISLQISQSSCVAFSPRLFNISDGISSTPVAFPSFISDIVNNISLLILLVLPHLHPLLFFLQPASLLSLVIHLYHIRTQYIASMFLSLLRIQLLYFLHCP